MKKTDIDNIINKWSFLTVNFEEKEPISLCLEAQFRMNETINNPEFIRYTVPMVIRIFSESKAAKRNWFFNNFDESSKPSFLTFKTKFAGTDRTGRSLSNLDEEAKNVADLSSKLAKELDSFFSDSMNKDVIFHGFKLLPDGTIIMVYN